YLRDGEPLTLEPAIEIGNIFKLGTRYSEPLGASYLDESGASHPVWMASYGIGPARIVAAAVEQFADEHGISWPKALAPFAVHLVALGKPGTPNPRGARPPTPSTPPSRRAGCRSSTTTATSAPARSSPTPSCSAARCARPWGGARWSPARSRS